MLCFKKAQSPVIIDAIGVQLKPGAARSAIKTQFSWFGL
jgi:hypothetical protein